MLPEEERMVSVSYVPPVYYVHLVHTVHTVHTVQFVNSQTMGHNQVIIQFLIVKLCQIYYPIMNNLIVAQQIN